MQRSIGVFFVHGSGYKRFDPNKIDWWRRDVGVGLRRGLTTRSFKRITLCGTSYGQIVSTKRSVPAGGGFPAPRRTASKEIRLRRCVCCSPGLWHRVYSSTVRTAFDIAPFVERWIAEEYRDVMTYLYDAEQRDRTLTRVCRDLLEHRPQIVIAHSLGSAVALDAVARLSATYQPRLLVTAGSPLG